MLVVDLCSFIKHWQMHTKNYKTIKQGAILTFVIKGQGRRGQWPPKPGEYNIFVNIITKIESCRPMCLRLRYNNWLGRKVKGKGHSSRRHNRRRQSVRVPSSFTGDSMAAIDLCRIVITTQLVSYFLNSSQAAQ